MSHSLPPERTPVIVAAARTPIGRFLGGLSTLAAPDLGAIAIRAAVARAGVDADAIGEVIMGNVLQAGVGQAPARQAAIKAGIPGAVPAVTINKVCGSGLQAVMQAAQAIRAGDEMLLVAGGQESMSNAPHYVRGMRTGVKFGAQTMDDGLIADGLWCAFHARHMGGHAEYTAKKAGITPPGRMSSRSPRISAPSPRSPTGGSATRSSRWRCRGRRGRPSSTPTRGRAPTRRSRRSRSCAPPSARMRLRR